MHFSGCDAADIAAHSGQHGQQARRYGPFYLKITTTRFGEKTYQSFEVYFTNSETSDPIFSCGRSFAADEVKSIGWSSEGYDVVVRLRNGSTITYPYDDVSSWQQ